MFCEAQPLTSSVVWVRELARNKDSVVSTCSVSPVVEFLAGLGGGAGRGGRGWARACWSESVSLLSVHVCSDDLRLAGQTAHGQALGGYRLCIPLLSLLSKAVHSPRRVVYFVRISFEKLTTPRLKWLAALVKFQDGKEFEPKGNAFQVKGALSNAATLDSLDGLSAFLCL